MIEMKRYRTIVVDPPWKTRTGPKRWPYGDNGGRPLEYPTMTIDEIKTLPVGELACDRAHLFLWTTNRLVRQAYDVAEAWGFRPSVLLTWAKNPMGMGLGDAFGITTEHVLFAHRGGLRPLRRVPTTWWTWKRGRHSQKPEAFQDIVETVSPGPYLEMFARRARPGWDVWGNEVESDVNIRVRAAAVSVVRAA
jgi:N6-adenosine-specific RNA methylase IME4